MIEKNYFYWAAFVYRIEIAHEKFSLNDFGRKCACIHCHHILLHALTHR